MFRKTDDLEMFDKTLHHNILSVKLPPLKFRYFEEYKISFKNCSFIHDSGQQQIDSETFNRSTSPGTMVHVQFVIFRIFEN